MKTSGGKGPRLPKLMSKSPTMQLVASSSDQVSHGMNRIIIINTHFVKVSVWVMQVSDRANVGI